MTASAVGRGTTTFMVVAAQTGSSPATDAITSGETAGNDHIRVGNGRDRVFGNAGNDTLYARGRHARLDGGAGHNVAYAPRAALHFAHLHSCQRLKVIPG
jgi:Ca2+-binding RTX toxin-like protein